MKNKTCMRISFMRYCFSFLLISLILISMGKAQPYCTLPVPANPGPNLITNPDFSAGGVHPASAVGFTYSSAYTYYQTPYNLTAGEISVLDDASDANNAWAGFDHTSGSGNFLVIDGSLSPSSAFWQQTISVNPNTEYYFSFWAMNLNSAIGLTTPNLEFKINGTPVAISTGTTQINLPYNPGNWEQICGIWHSGAGGNVTISINSITCVFPGNDIGIDDIEFYKKVGHPLDVVNLAYECDQHDYSLLRKGDGYLIAGNVYCDDIKVHVVEVDQNNSIVWSKHYFHDLVNASSSSCFSINEAPEGYILTGYIGFNDDQIKRLYLLYIDDAGNVLRYQLYDYNSENAVGLKVITSTNPDLERFVVGGFVVDPDMDFTPTAHKKAFLMATDFDLNVDWTIFFDNVQSIPNVADYNLVESILEVPGQGYFISGAMNLDNNAPYYGALAAMVDYNGNLLWNQSFHNTSYGQMGVDAFYDQTNDKIYHLSTNHSIRNIVITVFDPGGSIIQSAEYQPDQVYAGYHIMQSPYNSNHLIISGHIIEYSTVFLAEINKTNLAVNWAKNYQFIGGGGNLPPKNNFFQFSGFYPVHSPVNLVVNDNRPGFSLLSYRTDLVTPAKIHLVLFHTDVNGENCYAQNDDLTFMHNVTPVSYNITHYHENFTTLKSLFYDDPLHLDPSVDCICDYMDINADFSWTNTGNNYTFKNESTFNMLPGFSQPTMLTTWWLITDPASTVTAIMGSQANYTFSMTGTYTVQMIFSVPTGLSNPQYCVGQEIKTFNITVPKKTSEEIIIDSENELMIYPNPNRGSFIISSNMDMNNIIVTNVMGQVVYSVEDVHSDYLKLTLPENEKGIYFINIQTEDKKMITRKIIIN